MWVDAVLQEHIMKNVVMLITVLIFLFSATESFAGVTFSRDGSTVTVTGSPKKFKMTEVAKDWTIVLNTMGKVKVTDLSPTRTLVSYDFGSYPGSYRFERRSDLLTGSFQPAYAGLIVSTEVKDTTVFWTLDKDKFTALFVRVMKL